MKHKNKIILLLLISPLLGFGQANKKDALAAFENLMDAQWVYEGQWENGQKFKQEYVFQWGLNKQMVKVKTYGTVNQKTGEYGLRNEGIRSWDAQSQSMRFFEFDVYGGLTMGKCVVDENKIHYEYPYEIDGQEQTLRDTWELVDQDTYSFSVSMKTDQGWQLFTSGEIKRQTKE